MSPLAHPRARQGGADDGALLLRGSALFAAGLGIAALLAHAGVPAALGVAAGFFCFAYCVTQACRAFRAWRAARGGERGAVATTLRDYTRAALAAGAFLTLVVTFILERLPS